MTRPIALIAGFLGLVLSSGAMAAHPTNAREIHQAIRMGDLNRVLRILLESPRMAEHRSGDWSPLHAAVAANEPDIAALLLAYEPDTEVVDGQGRTPLLLAAEMPGRGRVMEVLLGAGANPLAKDARGRAPLDLAARTGDTDTMRSFVEYVKGRGDLELQLEVGEELDPDEDVDFGLRAFREPEMVPQEARQTADFEYEQGFRSMTGMVDDPQY